MGAFPSLVRTRTLVALLIVLVLAGGGLWLWTRARSSTPVTEASALRDYRDRAGDGGAAARTPGTPAPGVYSYRVSGWEKGGVGPLAIRRSLPRTARYVVTSIRGGYEERLAFSEEHIEGERYLLGRGGLHSTWVRTDVTFVGFGRDDRRALTPPPLTVPVPMRVGQDWSSAYRADKLHVRTRSRVLRAETLRLDGRPVRTLVLHHASVTSGPHPGTSTETQWWAPSLGMPVRWTFDGDTRGTVTFRVVARLDLVSGTPAR